MKQKKCLFDISISGSRRRARKTRWAGSSRPCWNSPSSHDRPNERVQSLPERTTWTNWTSRRNWASRTRGTTREPRKNRRTRKRRVSGTTGNSRGTWKTWKARRGRSEGKRRNTWTEGTTRTEGRPRTTGTKGTCWVPGKGWTTWKRRREWTSGASRTSGNARRGRTSRHGRGSGSSGTRRQLLQVSGEKRRSQQVRAATGRATRLWTTAREYYFLTFFWRNHNLFKKKPHLRLEKVFEKVPPSMRGLLGTYKI